MPGYDRAMRPGDQQRPGEAPPRFSGDRWRARFSDGGGPADWSGGRNLRLWLPVVVSFFAQVPFAIFRLVRPGFLDTDVRTAAAGLALAIIGPAVLIAARAMPGPVVALASAAASVDLLLPGGATGPPYVALAFAIVSAVVRGARGWAWVSVVCGWVITLVGGAIIGIQFRPFAVVGITLGILVVLGIAEGVRSRREGFAQYARSAAERRQAAAQEERVRIARELHDVLAHSLSQINVQAGVGLHLMPSQPEKGAEALSNIKESSRVALDEVRAVLGILRNDSVPTDGAPTDGASLAPEPDLARLPSLVGSVRAGGLAVEFESAVPVEPAVSVQLAVYRIVQEALTNVVRHSSASSVTVSVVGDPESIRVVVADDGVAAGSPTDDGRGIIGMRERAILLGGSLEASGTPSGFTVHARLPIGRGGAA